MAKISHREKILLGYNNNNNNNNNNNTNCLSNSSSSRRNSEVDFSDVFGGPPRCSSSTHEFHSNEIDSEDEDEYADDGNGYGLRMEKPVFGNGNQIGIRKRYESDDFYDDIFGGDQPLMSCSLSPRHHHISRSPASALEPSSSPSKFSLPGRMTSTTEISSSTSITQNRKFYGRSLSRFNHSFIENHHSTLNNGDDSNQLKSDSKKADDCSKRRSTFGNLYDNNKMQFHFSIYKWANKGGVPNNIVMSCSRKRSPHNEVDLKEDVIVECKLKDFKVEEINPTPPHNNEVGDVKEMKNSNMKKKQPLYNLFGQDKQGSKNATTPEKRVKGRKQSNVNDSEKPTKSLNKELFQSYKISRKSKVRESRTNDPQVKVEDFVKIFNKEDSSPQVIIKTKTKTKRDVMGSQNQSSRLMKDTPKFEPFFTEADDATLPTKNNGNNMQPDFENTTCSDFIHVVDGESLLSGEPESNFNGIEPNIDVIKGSSASKSSAPSVDDNQAKGVMQNKSQIAAGSKEETENYERKIRQWSKGKEGNIRALLSTMQNVLWANSGWKPIPLVEIIEANAVKKAYQRALLCLHPDKLQQKGAPPHHKFIAEKVFDILQEAWDQFNSIGMF